MAFGFSTVVSAATFSVALVDLLAVDLVLVDLVLVGADRIAANGDTVNKIGTYSLAVLAKENNIPFYVAADSSSIDFNKKTGGED